MSNTSVRLRTDERKRSQSGFRKVRLITPGLTIIVGSGSCYYYGGSEMNLTREEDHETIMCIRNGGHHFRRDRNSQYRLCNDGV